MQHKVSSDGPTMAGRGKRAFLVLIETSANQRYIFETNKLRENVGASELTFRCGTTWVLNAVEAWRKTSASTPESAAGVRNWLEAEARNPTLKSAADVRDWLEDKARNPVFAGGTDDIEVIVAISGKALLLTGSAEIARKIISTVTGTALKEAPGLDVCGAYEEFDWSKDDIKDGIKDDIGGVSRKLHEETFARARSGRPGPELRFLRLPPVDECATSGLPAARLVKEPEGQERPRSDVSISKRNRAEAARRRFALLVEQEPVGQEARFPKDLNELEQVVDNLQWVGIIHADGNGLGAVFGRFENYVEIDGGVSREEKNAAYVRQLREFSLSLDRSAEEAFVHAAQFVGTLKVPENPVSVIPLIPLILGGDDLTVICEGSTALTFTAAYLEQFEKNAADYPRIQHVARMAEAPTRRPWKVTASAGVALVKPHFPFSAGYQLSAGLRESAKRAMDLLEGVESAPRVCSALDFHVLHDTTLTDVGTFRARLVSVDGSELFARPYMIVDPSLLPPPDEDDRHLYERTWQALSDRVARVSSPTTDAEDDALLDRISSSQLHRLYREAFRGRERAEAIFAWIVTRTRAAAACGSGGELFWLADAVWRTAIVDTLEAREFMGTRDKASDAGGHGEGNVAIVGAVTDAG